MVENQLTSGMKGGEESSCCLKAERRQIGEKAQDETQMGRFPRKKANIIGGRKSKRCQKKVNSLRSGKVATGEGFTFRTHEKNSTFVDWTARLGYDGRRIFGGERMLVFQAAELSRRGKERAAIWSC